jgi:hypothetical protein
LALFHLLLHLMKAKLKKVQILAQSHWTSVNGHIFLSRRFCWVFLVVVPWMEPRVLYMFRKFSIRVWDVAPW